MQTDHSAALAHYTRQAELAASLPRFAPPADDSGPVLADYMDEAESRLLADMDLWQDWIGGHCVGRKCPFVTLPSNVGALQLVIDNALTAQLAAMLMYPSDTVRVMACKELQRRYLADHAKYLLTLADDLSWGEA